ncbi:hypothetical protein [Fundicoccus culcitae]|uniref:TIR domain-containing protein n=1 Tax=Fundicoccus culcitae TaxID=2969821 RepID=A0ABY5PA05_9LACT|nr:hypothetical protein [Fundicoccus culcitae]UUX35205.1 hypothetical protein NRE15_06060 [Fundicoccus culcitae]
MYKGYNLKIESYEVDILKRDLISEQDGDFNLEKSREKVHNTLNEQVQSFSFKESIDATELMGDWFPQQKFDVFISHSHNDLERAEVLANWLHVTFGLTSFIDSFVWKYAPDLLREIDNRYCLNLDGNSYDYYKRNFTTNQVYIMLANSLTSMIDRTECLIFLNTPNSVNIEDTVKNQSKSPWIFHELNTSQIIQRRLPDRKVTHDSMVFTNESRDLPDFLYKLQMEHLESINFSSLIAWKNKYLANENFMDSLDILYNS